MKPKDLLEQLQQLDPDADVEVKTTVANEDGREEVIYREPLVSIRIARTGRRTICLE